MVSSTAEISFVLRRRDNSLTVLFRKANAKLKLLKTNIGCHKRKVKGFVKLSLWGSGRILLVFCLKSSPSQTERPD